MSYDMICKMIDRDVPLSRVPVRDPAGRSRVPLREPVLGPRLEVLSMVGGACRTIVDAALRVWYCVRPE